MVGLLQQMLIESLKSEGVRESAKAEICTYLKRFDPQKFGNVDQIEKKEGGEAETRIAVQPVNSLSKTNEDPVAT